MRQIVLDTETTGLDTALGHRVVEIGCVELLHRRITGNNLHLYIYPDRAIDAGAVATHGLTLEQLEGRPRFHEIADDLRTYLGDADLIIHNAPFDLGFLNAEFERIDRSAPPLDQHHRIVDTLADARSRYPGQRNSLDALCRRFEIDNSARELHGALLDAELLADVYLVMTGGQIDIGLTDAAYKQADGPAAATPAEQLATAGRRPRVPLASTAEADAHARYLEMLSQASGGNCLWMTPDDNAAD